MTDPREVHTPPTAPVPVSSVEGAELNTGDIGQDLGLSASFR